MISSVMSVQILAQQLPPLPDSLQKPIDTASTPEIKADALLTAGQYYYAFYTTDGYNRAVAYYNQALQLSIKNNLTTFIRYSYTYIGSVYDALGEENLPKSLEFYSKYNQLAIVQEKDTGLITRSFTNMASVQQRLGKKQDCKQTLNNALTYLPRPKWESTANNVLLKAAFYMSKMDDYTACKNYFNQITKDSSSFKNKELKLRKFYLLTKMFLLKTENKPNEAIVYGNIALKEAVGKADSLELLSSLADFANQTNDFKTAYQLRNAEFVLYRGMIKTDALKNTDNNLLKSELFLKEENAKLLEKQKKLQQQFNYWLLAGLLLTLVLAALLFRFAAQRRKQNKILQKQNEEKAILLGEIHHRVKNNLEMLQSMLLLQMREYKEDENVQAALGEANNRIQSIALLHKQLYSGNLANTNANTYFTEMFARIMDDINNRRNFSIGHQLKIDSIDMPPDTILPLALLLNEWITNSAKYAFAKEQTNPLLNLTIKQKLNKVELLYADNGENAAAENSTGTGFGSRLINSLVKQLKGEMQVSKTAAGWEYYLTLPSV
jgi:two-component system, sensor histidine kinase PdtaS